MKTQLNGHSISTCDPILLSVAKNQLARAHEEKEDNWATPYLRSAYNNYRADRENGEMQDNPAGELKYDGKAEWERQPDGYCYIRYTEGPNDKLWMEAKDRNYVFRLEREEKLDQLEPNLQTEAPKLYEEVMAYKTKRAADVKTHMETETRKADEPKPM